MKEIELIKTEGGVVNLKYGDDQITNFVNCIESYSFFEDMERFANRALFHIKKENPKMKFDFNIHTMMTTPEQRREGLINHINSKHPGLDGKLICDIVDEETATIKPSGPDDDNHPNPFMKVPIDSDLIKAVTASVIERYEKSKNGG